MQRLEALLMSSRFYNYLGVITFGAVVALCLVMGIGIPRSLPITLGDNKTITIQVDKGIALLGVQCPEIRWDAINITLKVGQDAEELPSQGAKHVCSPQEAALDIYINAEDSRQTLYPILWISPYQLACCIFFVGVLIVVLRRPQWLGGYWPEAVFIISVTLIGSLYLLFDIERSFIFQHTALSLSMSLAAGSIAYRYRRQPQRALKLVCCGFIVVFWTIVTFWLFSPELLNYDERFYLSVAAAASGGHGLYPPLHNFPPMPVMGGVGHLAWVDVLAYQILGPSLYSLRFVTLVAGLLSLPAIFLLFRRWYGPVTAWLATALIPMTLLYSVALSIRMDMVTVTCLWWALLLVDVAREKKTAAWHAAAGLAIGLCLQAHIHTSIMAIAFGILYLIDYGASVRQARRWMFPTAVVAYSLGALFGLGLFIVFNILPDPDAFFRTAGNAARFEIIGISLDTPLLERLIKSLTALDVFWKLFLARLRNILGINPIELVFWLAALIMLVYRRSYAAARTSLILALGAVLIGIFILNNSTLFYSSHIGPPLLLCIPPFFAYGFSRRASFEWEHVTACFVLVLSTCVLPTYLISIPVNLDFSPPQSPYQEMTAFVKAHVSTECSIAGPGLAFVFDLPTYGLYYSSEVTYIGRSYFNYATDEELWQILQPDIVLTTDDGLTNDALMTWIRDTNYQEIFPAVWQKTHLPLSPDCVISS